jgi:FkbM family methyltransferase
MTSAISALVAGVLGDEKLLAVDCGSANGIQPHWQPLADVGTFVLFEPHPESYAALLKWVATQSSPLRWTILNVGLSEFGGRRTLYCHNYPTGSSLLPPDTSGGAVSKDNPYIYPLREVEVDTAALQAICAEQKIERVDLIKIDAQGAELEIIRGLGPELLDRLLAIEVEVISRPMYLGQSVLGDVHQLMTEHGLELFDLRPWSANWIAGGESIRDFAKLFQVDEQSRSVMHQLHEVDVVYFRSARQLLERADGAAIRRLLVCYCTYGFFPQAVWLTRKAVEYGAFNATQARSIEESLQEWHRALHRQPWDGRGRAWQFLRRVVGKAKALLNGPGWSAYGQG